MSGLELGLAIGAVIAPFAATLIAAAVGFRGVKHQIRQKDDADREYVRQKDEADREYVRQKDEADRRAEWWRRFERAVEWTTSTNVLLAASGYDTLVTLIRTDLASADEKALAERIALALVDPDSDNGA